MFEITFDLAWKRLERYGLSDADRSDVAQNVVITAFERRETFRPERGNFQQWLSGIVRREAGKFLRERGRQPFLAADDALSEAASEAPNPEDTLKYTQLARLADQAFACLPEDERRIVILHDIEGLSLRKVAELEGISFSTARARRERGMAKLRRADEEARSSGLFFPLPADILEPDDDGSRAPRELVDRAWRHVAPLLGLEDPPDSTPPPSGTRHTGPTSERDREPPPSTPPPSRRSGWLLRRLGPVVGALLLGLAASPVLDRCGDHHGGEKPAAAAASVMVVVSSSAGTAEPGFVADREAVQQDAPGATVPAPSTRPPIERMRGDAEDAELGVLDEARRALEAGRLGDVLAALADHANRFHSRESAARRGEMWAKLCKQYPAVASRVRLSELEQRCASVQR